MNKKETMGFNAKITPVKPLNDEMTLCKCYVMALGKNRNYSHISQETVENALPTIYNIPVVGNVYIGEDGEYYMGGHDMTIAKDSDGKLKFKSLCVPYGVVPQQDNIHFEEIIDSNGNKEIYQVADVILWTGRYPELQKAVYDKNIYFGQSMEINVVACKPLESDPDYTDISQFSYSALCLLGKSDDPDHHVEPCFPMSRVEPYHFSLDDGLFDEMMKEFKTELSNCFGAINIEKGGEDRVATEVLDSVESEAVEIAQDFEKADEMADGELKENFSNPDNVLEEESCTEEVAGDDVKTEGAKTEEDFASEELSEQETSNEDNIKFSCMTAGEKLELLNKIVRATTTDSVLYRSAVDYDDTYVYVWEESIDPNGAYSSKHCRVQYKLEKELVELFGDFETVYAKYLSKSEIDEIEKLRADYDELKQFKEKRLEDDRIKEYDDVVSQFSDLSDNEEFALLVKDKMSFESAEALKEKCYAIRGRATVVSTAKKPEMKFAIDYDAKQEPAVYGGFFLKYPPKSVETK